MWRYMPPSPYLPIMGLVPSRARDNGVTALYRPPLLRRLPEEGRSEAGRTDLMKFHSQRRHGEEDEADE